MRVALLTGDPFAGLAHYTSQLANALATLCEVTVVSPRGPIEGYLSPEVGRRLFDCGDLVFGPKLLRALGAGRIVSRLGVDVVHLQSYPPLLLAAIPFLPRPLVVTAHDPVVHPGARAAPLLALCRSLALRRADRLLVHAQVHGDILVRGGVDRAKIDVIPHGDYRFFRELAPGPVRSGSGRRVLFFGAVSRYKGLEVLLRASHRVLEEHPEAVFVIAGRGDIRPYRSLFPADPNLEIRNYYLPDEEAAALFAGAAVVVLPYTEASQSGVLAIAQAFGLPVVASRVGGLPEAVAHGRDGLLVDPGDVEGLAAAISRLLSRPEERLSLGRRGFLRQRSERSWDRVARLVLASYEEALGRPRTQESLGGAA